MGCTFKSPDTVKGDVGVALMPQLNILPLVCRPMLVSGACWSRGQGVVHIHHLIGYQLENVNMINVVVIHADTEQSDCAL